MEIFKQITDFLISNIDSNKNIIATTSMSVTVVGLSITLGIIPFQSLSKAISSNIYQIVLESRITKKYTYRNISLALIQILLLSFAPLIRLSELLSATLLILVIINAFKAYLSARKWLDVNLFCIGILETDIDKVFKAFHNYIQIVNTIPEKQIENLERKIIDGIMLGRADTSQKKDFLPPEFERAIKYKLHNFCEIAEASLTNKQYGTFEKSIQSIISVLVKYLEILQKYYVSIDNLFLEESEFFQRLFNRITKEKHPFIYWEILTATYFGLVSKIEKINLDHDFYLNTILSTYFKSIKEIEVATTYYDALKMVENILSIFKRIKLKMSVKQVSDFLCSQHAVTSIINNALLHSLINRIGNIFSFYIFTSSALFEYDEYEINNMYKIIETHNANNLMTPMIGPNDFTTHMALNINDDKSLSNSIYNLLFRQYEFNQNDRRVFYIYETILKNIDVLMRIYHRGGTHVNEIIEQLYRVVVDIYLVLDQTALKRFYHTDFILLNSNEEKKNLRKIMIQAIENICNALNKDTYSRGKEEIIYSCVKILLAEAKVNKVKLINYKRLLQEYYIKMIVPDSRFNSTTKNMILDLLEGKIKGNLTTRLRYIINYRQDDMKNMWRYDSFDQYYLKGIPINDYAYNRNFPLSRINKLVKK